jgi:flagellar protein FliS
MKPSTPASDTTNAMNDTTVNPYLRDAVMTASPEQLQLMLYDGAIRFALQGRDAIARKDYEGSYEKLTRAQHIILEMLSGLNYEVNPELCKRLASIYNFLYRKLVDACVKRDVNEIDDGLRVLRMERETWQMLVDKVNRIRDGAESSDESTPAPADGEPVKFTARV